MSQSERQKVMGAAYTEATKRLRQAHEQEFHDLLEQVYEERGLSVRKRLTGERLREAEIAKARAVLASHGAL